MENSEIFKTFLRRRKLVEDSSFNWDVTSKWLYLQLCNLQYNLEVSREVFPDDPALNNISPMGNKTQRQIDTKQLINTLGQILDEYYHIPIHLLQVIDEL